MIVGNYKPLNTKRVHLYANVLEYVYMYEHVTRANKSISDVYLVYLSNNGNIKVFLFLFL